MSFEDCIDVVRDWVIAQAYATIAWVQANYFTEPEIYELLTPVHVTGITIPDVTCTYHRAGVQDGKPYYRRENGEYWIWWHELGSYWVISRTVDVLNNPRWLRIDPVIEGVYLPVVPAQGIPTVVANRGCPDVCAEDRGDPALVDFAIGDLTADGAWHDLDLSGIVPTDQRFVLLAVVIANSSINRLLQIRKKGNANIPNASIQNIQVANVALSSDCTNPISQDGFLEYNLTAGGWIIINITVKGWWV